MDRRGQPWRVRPDGSTERWRYDGEGNQVDATAVSTPAGFPGQYVDAETGLSYNYHRYYAPRPAGTAARTRSVSPVGPARKTPAQNAYGHWKKYGKECPHLQNARQYVRETHGFMENPPLMTTSGDCPDHPCRVCGYDLEEPPWGPDGSSPTYIICDCCGCEAGLDDVTREAVVRYRERWIRDGAAWFDPKARPVDWDLQAQLACVPAEFR